MFLSIDAERTSENMYACIFIYIYMKLLYLNDRNTNPFFLFFNEFSQLLNKTCYFLKTGQPKKKTFPFERQKIVPNKYLLNKKSFFFTF